MIDPKEEYKQISEDWRHRDNLTWQLPSVVIVIGSAFTAAAFTLDIDLQYLYVIRPILLLFGGFLSLCLTYALKENLWYQIGSGEALIKIAQNKGDEIPTDKVRRIIRPEDLAINESMKQLRKKHRLIGSYFFIYFVFLLQLLFLGCLSRALLSLCVNYGSVNMFDVCIIGHITKDILRIKNEKKEMPGGVAYYFSIALKNLGSKVSLITKVARKDKDLFNNLIRNDIPIFYKDSQKTTTFENIYSEDLDIRIQKVKCVAQPFISKDIPDISARIFHFGPLTKEDIPLEMLKLVSKKAKVSLDIQGFLRKIEKGKVESVDWEEKEEALTYVNILKTDETEAKILSGEDNIRNAAEKLSAYSIDEIIITLGSKGSLIYSKGNFYSIPSFPPKKIVDATGCGDTYMAAYIYQRLKSSNIEKSGKFAAATASLKLEILGPFQGSEEDVLNSLEYQSINKDNLR